MIGATMSLSSNAKRQGYKTRNLMNRKANYDNNN